MTPNLFQVAEGESHICERGVGGWAGFGGGRLVAARSGELRWLQASNRVASGTLSVVRGGPGRLTALFGGDRQVCGFGGRGRLNWLREAEWGPGVRVGIHGRIGTGVPRVCVSFGSTPMCWR